ncbi:MAG: hypothetical protein ACKOWD_18255 [Rhodoferax sp.]
MFKQRGEAIRGGVLALTGVVEEVLWGQAAVGAQVARRGGRFDPKAALDVRARQVTTEERFDFNVEKSLSLRLRQVV